MHTQELLELVGKLNGKYLFDECGMYISDDGDPKCVTDDVHVDGLRNGVLDCHSGMDFIYAMASTAYNSGYGCRLWVFIEALELFKRCLPDLVMRELTLRGQVEEIFDKTPDQFLEDIDYELGSDQFDCYSYDPEDTNDDKDDTNILMDFLNVSLDIGQLYTVIETLESNLENLEVSSDILCDVRTLLENVVIENVETLDGYPECLQLLP